MGTAHMCVFCTVLSAQTVINPTPTQKAATNLRDFFLAADLGQLAGCVLRSSHFSVSPSQS
jgi:hypothetical protein